MKRNEWQRVVILSVWLLACAVSLMAQSYNALWKQVKAYGAKDMPQSAIEVLDKIVSKSQTDGNGAMFLKAMLVRRQFANDISPDSARTYIPLLEKQLKAESREPMQALYHAALGYLCADAAVADDDSLAGCAQRHFEQSLVHPSVLFQSRASDFVPVVLKGRNGAIFQDDLLNVVTRFSCEELLNMASSRPQCDSIVRQAYAQAIATYQSKGLREAALLFKLDSLETLNARNGGLYYHEDSGKQEDTLLFRNLLKQYGDVASAPLIYLHFANRCGTPQKTYEWATECLRKYPKSKYAPALRNIIARMTCPTLDVSFKNNQSFPEQEDSLKLSAVHVTDAVLRFYKTDLAASDPILRNDDESVIKKLKKPAFELPIHLDKAAPYRRVETKVLFRAPEPGIYYARLESKDASSSFVPYYVSRLQVTSLSLSEKKVRVVVSEAQSGQPVVGARVTMMQQKETNVISKTCVTNDRGEAVVSVPRSSGYKLFAETSDDRYCQGLGMSWMSDGGARWNSMESSRNLALYTDRAVYRPGQDVKVGGFLYQKQGDNVHVCSQSSVVLKLLDSRRKEIAQKKITTDSMGVVGATFKLPSQCLNGTFVISSEYGQRIFSVEAYKRPTYKLSFENYRKPYAAGDTILLEASARTFADFPMPHMRVAVSVKRRNSPWFEYFNSRERELYRDTLQTDAEGKVFVPVPLDISEEKTQVRRRFYLYSVDAVALADNGEVETANYSLSAGTSDSYLSTSLGKRICKEVDTAFVVRHVNLNGEEINDKGTYSLTLNGEVKKSGEIVFNKIQNFDFAQRLPSGTYRLKIVPDGNTDTTVVLNHSFTLFSLKDNRPVGEEKLQTFQSAYDFSKGEVAVYVATPEKNACVRCDVFSNSKLQESRLLQLSDSALVMPFRYKESDGNGIEVAFALVRDGAVYTASHTIRKPEPNKELTFKWKSFRNRLRPGQEEEWTLQVLRNGKPVSASVMATLYDASLDKFRKLAWPFNLNFDRSLTYYYWKHSYSRVLSLRYEKDLSQEREYSLEFDRIDRTLFNDVVLSRGTMYDGVVLREYSKNMPPQQVVLRSNKMGVNAKLMGAATRLAEVAVPSAASANVMAKRESADEAEANDVQPRENFNENAFFESGLVTNKNGEVCFSFKLPQSLTRWNLKVLAHSREVDYGVLDTFAIVQKDFMVQPYMPRFLRSGDNTSLSVSLRNVTQKQLSGTVRLELKDAESLRSVHTQKQSFNVGAADEAVVNFPVEVTEQYPLLICVVTADCGTYSDGEQYYLPVLADYQQVTNTQPLSLKGSGKHVVNLLPLYGNRDKQTKQQKLTIEYTSNPAWMALSALPTLARPIRNDALSMAGAYYALSMATIEANADSRVRLLAESWSQGKVDTTFLPLERNADVKQMLEYESPWVAEAENERKRLEQLVGLFNPLTLSYRRQSYLDKLVELQNISGSWSWFKGMPDDRETTLSVCDAIAKLTRIDSSLVDAKAIESMNKALGYLDKQMEQDVVFMKKQKKTSDYKPSLSNSHLRYLQLCAMMHRKKTKTINYLVELLNDEPQQYDMYNKALAANVLASYGQRKESEEVLKSLMEHTVCTPEMGRYFDTKRAEVSYSSYRIPTQVAVLDAITQLKSSDTTTISEMTQWLLQAKRTQGWGNSRNSVDAIYYLFLQQKMLALNALNQRPRMLLKLQNGKQTELIQRKDTSLVASTLGYYRFSIDANNPATKPVSLTIEKPSPALAFGAVYLQSVKPSADIEKSASGLALSCQYDVKRGNEWIPVSSATVLQKGDIVRARYEIVADRDYDFVFLKEGRPACGESVDVLSGYDWRSGCYRNVNDGSTEYFYRKMSKGRHVQTSQMRIVRTGEFSSAAPIVECVYAPEFSARTAPVKWTVKK